MKDNRDLFYLKAKNTFPDLQTKLTVNFHQQCTQLKFALVSGSARNLRKSYRGILEKTLQTWIEVDSVGKHVTRSILKINNSFVLGWDHKPQLAEIDFSLVLCFERFFRKNQWKTGPPRILFIYYYLLLLLLLFIYYYFNKYCFCNTCTHVNTFIHMYVHMCTYTYVLMYYFSSWFLIIVNFSALHGKSSLSNAKSMSSADVGMQWNVLLAV